MKKLKCHCGSVEAEINVDGDLEKIVTEVRDVFPELQL
mgnify:CR=1 FL=1